MTEGTAIRQGSVLVRRGGALPCGLDRGRAGSSGVDERVGSLLSGRVSARHLCCESVPWQSCWEVRRGPEVDWSFQRTRTAVGGSRRRDNLAGRYVETRRRIRAFRGVPQCLIMPAVTRATFCIHDQVSNMSLAFVCFSVNFFRYSPTKISEL